MKRQLFLLLLSLVSLFTWADGYTDVTDLLIGNSKFPTVSSSWWDSTQGWLTDISGGNLRVLANSAGNDVDPGECTTQPNSLERWTSSAFPSGKRILYNEINVPNGKYRLRMASQAANLNASDKANADSVYVYANGTKAKVTNAKALKYYELDVAVTGGKLEIGLATGKGNACNYANIADVTLLVANGTVDCTQTIDSLKALTAAGGKDEKIDYLIGIMQDSISDYAKVEAFTKTAKAIREYSISHASTTSPADVTQWVTNAACTDRTGWSRNAADAAADFNTDNKEFDNSLYSGTCIESWYWSPVKGADLIWQKLTGLMPGTYKVTALCVGQVYNDNSHKGQCREGLYFFAGDNRVAIDSPTWKEYETSFEVKAGETVTIGITADDGNLNDWTGITRVRLYLTGVGEGEKMFLSDDYDCNALQSDTYADVSLHMQMRKGDYATLCLPFDMPMTTARECFSRILSVKDATAVGNDISVTGSDAAFIEAGESYIVRAAKDIDGVLTIPGVMVYASQPATKTVGVAKMTGSYRSSLSSEGDYLLQKDDSTRLHRPTLNTTLKAYTTRITKHE